MSEEERNLRLCYGVLMSHCLPASVLVQGTSITKVEVADSATVPATFATFAILLPRKVKE